MGGHSSKQSLSVSSALVTNATLNQTQDCLTSTSGENVINIFGDGNVAVNIDQTLTLTTTANCSSILGMKTDFDSKLNDQISQSLKSQDIALTSWLTPGSDNQSANINHSVTTNINTNLVQKCISSLSGRNVINVVGSQNVLKNDIQKQTASMLAGCMQSNSQSLSTMTDITDTINQHEVHTSENPLAFLTDALQAMVRDIAIAAAVVFVAVIFIVVAGKFMAKRARAKASGAKPA